MKHIMKLYFLKLIFIYISSIINFVFKSLFASKHIFSCKTLGVQVCYL